MKLLSTFLGFLAWATLLNAQNPVSPPATAPSGVIAAPANSVVASSPSVAANDTKISSGDTIQFSILGETETTTPLKVSQQGTVSLPFIGDVKVLGLSVSEARETISNLYKPDYYVNPQVNLIVTSSTVKAVYFLGNGINRPGPVEIPSDRDLYLLEAISKAGGISRVGEPKAQIKRIGSDGKTITLPLINIKKIGTQEYKLEPGDVINFDEFGIFGPS